MNENNFLTIVAIVAVCVALVNMGITINKIGDIKELTGYATDTGQANLTIESSASVSFVTSTVDWGSGSVVEASGSAWMDTEGNNYSGNWTVVSQGLTLENQGNCNVTFSLTTSNIATSFIGGDGAEYEIKLTDNETGACGANSLSTYTNATAGSQTACTNMGYTPSTKNAVDIDINITIPEGATPGAKGSIITASANCI